MRYRITADFDTTRTNIDQLVNSLRSSARQRLGAGSFVHIVVEQVEEPRTSEQVGTETL